MVKGNKCSRRAGAGLEQFFFPPSSSKGTKQVLPTPQGALELGYHQLQQQAEVIDEIKDLWKKMEKER